MNLKKIREKSLAKAKSLGFETNSNLPLLDQGVILRTVDEIIERSLALFAVVAASYGFSKKSAISWLEKEGIYNRLVASEKSFLADDDGDVPFIQSQVEALNAYAWSLGIVNSFEFDQVCRNDLIRLFPDIKNNGNSMTYKAKAKLRCLEDIVTACDLAYCLHWAIVQSLLENKILHNDVGPHVIIERRRALEWMLSKDDWDELSLDT